MLETDKFIDKNLATIVHFYFCYYSFDKFSLDMSIT